MISVVDASARAAALDPGLSFCVSAPAGSGKTELLIQRYLCLLSRVKRPEQVLAITFTRKAAAEMRHRVVQALQSALADEPNDNPHQRVTRELAQNALAADAQRGWGILQNVARFNIKTIDSFCAGLTRQMPVLSLFGGQSTLLDDADPLYVEAVLELLQLLREDHPVTGDLAALLLHFDNNWDRLQQLLVSMLARREQWRGYLGVHYSPDESQAYLIATVASLVHDELSGLSQLLAPHAAEILELLQHAASNLALNVPTQFPGCQVADLPVWRSVGKLLLTKQDGWRNAFSKREGFPSGKGEPQRRKEQVQALLIDLQHIPGLQARLAHVRILPEIEVASVSWQLVLHLSRLLPTLAAQLLLVFRKHGVVDHSQVAQSALVALGADDAPTELALRLDYQIEHILVDEFQDTAVTQYELLHKLTRGWGEFNEQYPDAPRTLMIVGDAMQSIYGFRGANVGLFIKARQEGFNGVDLQHIALECNFRSDRGLVTWFNQTFASAFPDRDDVFRSQVRYSPAVAVRPQGIQQPVEMHAFSAVDARSQEVEFICTRIAECVAAGEDTLAVLGRSRSHLQPIIARLKQLDIAYNAPDLDSLAQSPVVADLLILCRALANFADRLAWMALLRAPWCGMQLVDLLCVSRFAEASPYTSLWSSLQSVELQHVLTEDGRLRLQHVLPVLQQASAKRDRLGLRAWIEQAWVALGGPQCVPEADGLLDAENFLQLLELAEVEGVGLDPDWLFRRLQQRYMSAGDSSSRIHLMTLHKAKGLEFDCVIIPQLDRIPRTDGREILLWDEHSSALGERSFLLAADDRSSSDAPTLYNYLKIQRQKKILLESTRLLYVGATRAVRRLLLTASVRWDENTDVPLAPPAQSLLNSIWEVFVQQMIQHKSSTAVVSVRAQQLAPPLTRLHRSLLRPMESAVIYPPHAGAARTVVRQNNHAERCIGIVVHLALEELSREPVLPLTITVQNQRRWRMALQRQGLWHQALDEALNQVIDCIHLCLQPEHIGRWILSTEHKEAHSEWALTVVAEKGAVRDIVIDRSFIDRTTGLRWVIDYKNSRPGPGESLADFLARETSAYFEQLQCYCAAVRGLSRESGCCALYFTALGKLHRVSELDWTATESGPISCSD